MRAPANADDIVGGVQDELRAYLTLRASTHKDTQIRPADSNVLPTRHGLLVLGCVLQLADVQGTLRRSLMTAGWVLAVIAAMSTLTARPNRRGWTGGNPCCPTWRCPTRADPCPSQSDTR
ncbi:hypothetical protein [Streptomyces sp. UG1]|uniref:hypothetical protein n=1 Tax=Streptomyces sp. UG1 TaxID=3417652 RepID=UPI003CEF8E83